MALQNIRSNTASKRPLASGLSDGQIAVNTNETSPGLFFKGASGAVLKVGPVHIGASAPNSSPAVGGSTGNAVGEQWLDTTGGNYVLKVWDGTAWRDDLVGLATASNDGLLSSSDFTKLGGIATGAEVNTVDSVAGKTGAVSLVKGDVGLGNVDNTSDVNKPVSTATQTALNAKADLVGGVIPTSQIPAIAITDFLGTVASQTAMLALTGEKGDWCLRSDKAVAYVITGNTPSQIGSWTAVTVPGSAVTTVNNQVGTVTLGPSDVGAATTAQGSLADSAVQPTDSVGVLADVDLTTAAPTDGQALIWDNAAGKFVPGEAGLVDSVNSQTGNVVLDTDDITEGTANLYSQWDNATGGINYAGGNVGIGDTTPGEKLEVNGNILASGDITAFSDISLKKNIEVIPDALNKILQLRGVTYDRTDIEEDRRQSGVIAQEVEKVLPEVVHTHKDGIKSVAYGNLVGLLIESIKDLKAEIEQLKGGIN